jgi:hypothetical protein
MVEGTYNLNLLFYVSSICQSKNSPPLVIYISYAIPGIQVHNCRGQPLGSPKTTRGILLKTCKNQTKHIPLKHTHGARPTLRRSPRPTRAAHSKAPSSRFRLARGFTPPSSRFRLARGFMAPSSGLRLARGFASTSLEAPPHARPFPHAGMGI